MSHYPCMKAPVAPHLSIHAICIFHCNQHLEHNMTSGHYYKTNLYIYFCNKGDEPRALNACYIADQPSWPKFLFYIKGERETSMQLLRGVHGASSDAGYLTWGLMFLLPVQPITPALFMRHLGILRACTYTVNYQAACSTHFLPIIYVERKRQRQNAHSIC